MNRAQLKLAIMAWLHRASFRTPVASDFDATAGFIAIAEQDMNEKLRARCMIVRTQQQVDGQYLTLPCDLLEPFDARIQNGPPLLYVSRDTTATALWQQSMGTPGNLATAGFAPDFMPIINPPMYPWQDGTPRAFTIVGGEIEFTPFPSADPNAAPGTPVNWPVCELTYYQRILLGPDDDDTNAVLSTYPGIYIYGALVQSAPFLRDDSRVQTWAGLYTDLINGANAEHERARSAGSRLVQRHRRLA
jgi:hypothetical protein